MKNYHYHYTPRSIIRIIMSQIYKAQYKQLIAENQNRQIFPPPPNVDEVLNSLRLTEAYIIESERQSAKNIPESLTTKFFIRCLQNINISEVFRFATEGELRPMFFYLNSPFFESTPIFFLLLEDCVKKRFKRSAGRKPQQDRWKYYFSREWLVEFNEEQPDSAIKRLEKFFGKCRSTVNKRIQELKNTDDEARILEIIEIAKAYPEMRQQYLDAYCKEFRGLFGHR